jgi:hypothetical protein
MTTFADREHAIEAHYAARELAAFRERARRYRRLGFRLAALLNLHGKEARRFAVRLSEQCIGEPSDEGAYRRMAKELAGRGLGLSGTDVRGIALSGRKAVPVATIAAAPRRSWIEFVTTELLALFTGNSRAPVASPEGSRLLSAP